MYPRLSRSFPSDSTPTPAEVEAALKESRTPDTLPLEPPPSALPKPSTPEQVLESVLEVRFSPLPSEPVRASQTIELLCSNPGAIIRYATDAEDVDESATLYDAEQKILLTASTSLAARAWINGVAGPLATARYEIAKSLWEKREPTDRADAVEHEATLDFDFVDGWHASAASTRGKLHAHRALWREDSFTISQSESASGTWAILAVADGAGSATLSRVGSRLACESAVRLLEEALREQVLDPKPDAMQSRDLPLVRDKLVAAASCALQVLGEEAQRRQRPLSEFATTLLLLVRCAWGEQQVCGGLQVGDGVIALLNGDGMLRLLGEADHGEHSSETRFLTTTGIEAEFASRVQFSIRSDLRAVAVMSDGVSDDFFPESQRLPAMLSQVLERIEEGRSEALLDWIGYEKRGSSDDRTLLVSWRARPSTPRPSTWGEAWGEGGEVEDATEDRAA
jgi:hypothetical protein